MLGFGLNRWLSAIKGSKVLTKVKKLVRAVRGSRSTAVATATAIAEPVSDLLVDWTAPDLKKPFNFYPMGEDETSIWSGPAWEAGFHVQLPAGGPYRFQLGFNRRMDRPSGVGLHVKIDNTYVDTTDVVDGGQDVFGEIPARRVAGIRRVSFIVDSTFVPAKFDPSIPDVRYLGMSLHRFRVWR